MEDKLKKKVKGERQMKAMGSSMEYWCTPPQNGLEFPGGGGGDESWKILFRGRGMDASECIIQPER